MRISKTLVTGAVAAVAVAGTANASTVIDNFTNATAPSAASLGPFGSGYNGLGTFSNTGQTGSGIVGSRLVYDNSSGGTVASTMSGNGQWRAVVTGGGQGSYSDTQLISQYRFGSVLDFSQGFGITGSGTASGGGTYSYQDIDWTEGIYDPTAWTGEYEGDGTYTGQMVTINETEVGYGIGIQLMMGANNSGGYTGRMWCQFDMYGSQSLGNFTFTAADFAAALAAGNFVGTIDLTQVNAIGVYQYAYSGDVAGIASGTWDYTATSFSIVPAPGAIALLGAAGLVGTRRRR
jgi:hypothetical protein